MREQRLIAIKDFCRFIDRYEGEMIIKGGQIFNSKNELIYLFKL